MNREEDDLPDIYYSPDDFGPNLVLPILPEMTFDLAKDISNPFLPWGQAHYEKIDYIEKYNFQRRETRHEYYERIKKELKQFEDIIWYVHDDGYPNLAAIIVEIHPAWVYRRIK